MSCGLPNLFVLIVIFVELYLEGNRECTGSSDKLVFLKLIFISRFNIQKNPEDRIKKIISLPAKY